MKKHICVGLAILTLSSNGYAGYTEPTCVPEYIKQNGAGFVSAFVLPGVLALNVLARVGDLPNQNKNIKNLTCTTVAIAGHAATTPMDVVPSLRK